MQIRHCSRKAKSTLTKNTKWKDEKLEQYLVSLQKTTSSTTRQAKFGSLDFDDLQTYKKAIQTKIWTEFSKAKKIAEEEIIGKKHV